MNEFDKEKLEEFSKSRRHDIERTVKEICEAVADMDETVEGIRRSDDDVEMLRHAKKAHKRLNLLEIRYMGLLNIKMKLGMIDENEYTTCLNAISGDNYEDIYPLIKNFNPDSILRKVDMFDFTPEKGTSEYCECKGYYNIRRIDMGRMIKRDLLNKYPHLNFSVKTDGTNLWNERALVKVTETDPEILNEYGGFREDFLNELRTFLQEYEPRIRIGLETYRWR